MKKEKKKSRLQLAQESAEIAINKTNEVIDELGGNTGDLHDALKEIQDAFDCIRNIPSDEQLEYEKLKQIRLDWKQQAQNIDEAFKKAEVKGGGIGAAGVGAGVAVAALGPTAAMGVATTFGVASTGTAISALSGAAATNAALAWLGGGALAAGGGGMVAGNAFLALAGPVGWAIAGIALVGSGIMLFKARNDHKKLEDTFALISKRDCTNYELAIVELNERIKRIINETGILHDAITRIKTFGLDYNKMTESQQYELGSYVNLMNSSTQLLVNPILGLKPKYTEDDFKKFSSHNSSIVENSELEENKELIISLCNLLYRIDIDDNDKKLLTKGLKKNKDFLESVNSSKRDFEDWTLDVVCEALEYKYSLFYKLPDSFEVKNIDYKKSIDVNVTLENVPENYEIFINNVRAENNDDTYSMHIGPLTFTKDIPISVKYCNETVSEKVLTMNINNSLFGKVRSFFANYVFNHFKWKAETVFF